MPILVEEVLPKEVVLFRVVVGVFVVAGKANAPIRSSVAPIEIKRKHNNLVARDFLVWFMVLLMVIKSSPAAVNGALKFTVDVFLKIFYSILINYK